MSLQLYIAGEFHSEYPDNPETELDLMHKAVAVTKRTGRDSEVKRDDQKRVLMVRVNENGQGEFNFQAGSWHPVSRLYRLLHAQGNRVRRHADVETPEPKPRPQRPGYKGYPETQYRPGRSVVGAFIRDHFEF